MRLIDVEKLKQYIDDCECCEKCDMKGFMCSEDCELPDCVTPQWERVLNEQPTVDDVPVRHAYWIRHEDWEEEGGCGWECSECGMGSEVDYTYCMKCGARMDKDETD